MKDSIQYSDFEKLDIRVGKIVSASAPDWSKKLLEFNVDFGEEIGERTILAGIKEYIEPEQLEGLCGVFLVNLEAKKMGESESQGMMLMADEDEAPLPLIVSPDVKPGTIVR